MIKKRFQIMLSEDIIKKVDKILKLDSLTFKNRKHIIELAINEYYIQYLNYWETKGINYSRTKPSRMKHKSQTTPPNRKPHFTK